MKLSVEQISRENEEEVIISRHIMLSTFFMCLLFNPASQLPVVSFFGRCILFTLVCMATLVVYYSRTELTLRGWWIRTIVTIELSASGIAATARATANINESSIGCF